MATAVRRPPQTAERLIAEALRQQGAFFDAARRPSEEFLRLALDVPGGFDPLEVEKIREAQMAYQERFQRSSATRMRAGLREAMTKPTRLTIIRALRARQRDATDPDTKARLQQQIEAARFGPDERRTMVAKVLERERRYALAHAMALAGRARGANRATQVRTESPTGALWRRNPESDSCERCRFMDGKLWPWEVLDRFSPPVHPNCQCVLVPVGAARRNGWVGPKVLMPSAKQAIHRARRVLQESASGAILVEAVRRGVYVDMLGEPVYEGLSPVWREDVHPRDLLGRFRPKLAAFLGKRPHPSAPNVLKARGLEVARAGSEAHVTYRGQSREVILRPEDPTTGLYRDLTPEEAQAEVESAIAELVATGGPRTEDTGGLVNPARLAEVYDGFEHGGLKVRVNYSRKIQGTESVELEADVLNENGTPVGHMVRNFKSTGEDAVAYHNIIQIDEDYQGRGLGAALSEHVENGYRDLGIAQITLDTDEVGGYAWARAGYEATPRSLRLTLMGRASGLYDAHKHPGLSAGEGWDETPTRVPSEFRDRWPEFMAFLGAEPATTMRGGRMRQWGWAFPDPPVVTVGRVAAWGAENPVIIDGRQMWLGKWFLLGTRWEAVKRL